MTCPEMNVARWEKDGAITVMSTPIPTLKPGEMLIKVAASGLCGKIDTMEKGKRTQGRSCD
jgi:D-arabinose 1-dehydrogenase-like Zn-dependent alcohol dehydrogenase